MIVCDERGVTVQDLGSKNHTFVDTDQIDSTVSIKPGAAIRFGDVDCVLRELKS